MDFEIDAMATTTAWQHTSLENTNLYMLEKEVLCDITFLVGEEKEAIKCHKFMLVSRSPVFYSMFCGTMAETSETVALPDIEPKIWQQFLKFLYGGFCDIDGTTVLRLLYIAKKYDIPALGEKCKQYLENNIDVETVGTILDQAITFEETVLKQKCLKVVSRETSGIFKSTGFLSLSKNALKSVLELNEMEVMSEEDVYQACKKWAAEASAKEGQGQVTAEKLRSALADCLPLIRFPSMPIETFVSKVSTENILTTTEKLQIIQDIVMKGSSSGFCAKGRSRSITFDVQRMTDIPRGDWWSHTGKQDGISFLVSDDVKLVAVAIYLPSKEGEVSGPVEILEDQTIVQSMDITLKYQSGETFQFVTLKKEISLKSGIMYSIRQRLAGTNTFYGKKDMGKQIIHDTEIRFKNLCAGTSDNSTSTATGQIHGIRLKKFFA